MLAVWPAKNNIVPPLTLTAAERDSCGSGSTNSFLKSCPDDTLARANRQIGNNNMTVFIALSHHSNTRSLLYSNCPLFLQHSNRLDLQQSAGSLELSGLHEGARRIPGFEYLFTHVSKNFAPASFGGVNRHRNNIVQ